MQRISEKLRTDKKVIGFVPTMGFLHAGHVSLIQKCKKNADVSIVSIFVNPTQFTPNEDLESYPRDIEKDKLILKKNKVDYLFLPDSKEIYPQNFSSYLEVFGLTDKFEGQFRPTHFRGVTTVVAILINITKPHQVFFGQKDAQQAIIVKKMIEELKFSTKLIICPLVREPDGLAMSSRNIYLSSKERNKALLLSKSLNLAKKIISEGEKSTASIIKKMNNIFIPEKAVHLNYIAIVEADSFAETETLENGKSYFILIAARVGNTRLIDNILLKVS